jgi:hypothetical protein
MVKLGKKILINAILSLLLVFFTYGVYSFTGTVVDEGTWVILFLLLMIFLEVSSKKG